jgi:hypothetical protein
MPYEAIKIVDFDAAKLKILQAMLRGSESKLEKCFAFFYRRKLHFLGTKTQFLQA